MRNNFKVRPKRREGVFLAGDDIGEIHGTQTVTMANSKGSAAQQCPFTGIQKAARIHQPCRPDALGPGSIVLPRTHLILDMKA